MCCLDTRICSGKISGAHVNPAGSFALALVGDLAWILVPIYWIAQYLGAFVAATLIYLNNMKGIDHVGLGLKVDRPGPGNDPTATGHIFATHPINYLDDEWPAYLLDQAVATCVLFLCLSAISDSKNSGLEKRHQPLAVCLAICAVCIAFNINCGAILNPARDLGPRLLMWMVGYPSSSIWGSSHYWFLAGVLGPHVGAILGVFGYKYGVGHWLKRMGEDYQSDNDNPRRVEQGAANRGSYSIHHKTTELGGKAYTESPTYGSTVIH